MARGEGSYIKRTLEPWNLGRNTETLRKKSFKCNIFLNTKCGSIIGNIKHIWELNIEIQFCNNLCRPK